MILKKMEQNNLLNKAKQLQAENKRVLITFNDGSKVAGEIYFVGWNKFLNFEQITVNKTPYKMSEIVDVEEHIIETIF